MSPNREDALREAVDTLQRIGLDPDSPGGARALDFLLSEPELVDTEPPAASRSTSSRVEDQEPDTKLADWVGIDHDRVRDVVEFGDGQALLRVGSSRLPKSKAEKQRVLTLLKLASDRIAYGAEEVSAQKVNAVCDDYNCADQNLPHNVAARGDLVTRRGKRGAYVYRATQPGAQRARELFSELLDGEGELRV